MWLNKLRQLSARSLAAKAIAAVSAALVITGVVTCCRATTAPDARARITAEICRYSLASCGRGAGHAEHEAGAALAALSDRFSYRARPTQADPSRGYGRTLTVGKGKDFSSIARALSTARNGDIIAIAPGNYPGESMRIERDDLIVRGQDGIATIDLTHRPLLQNKAIFITQGRNLLMENLELKGAFSTDRNGAGIRAEGVSLHVRNCFIHDNQAGILVSNRRDSSVLVEYSEFARNGHRDGQAHQIYAGLIAELQLRYNYIHDSVVGSAIKSRAARNLIEYNYVADGAAGSANYTVDLSVGGYARLVGNVLEKGPHAHNRTFVSYAPELLAWQDNSLFLSHNTLVSDRFDSTFITNHTKVELHAINNLFIGRGAIVDGGPVQLIGNMVLANPRYGVAQDSTLGGSPGSNHNRVVAAAEISNRAQLDYHLLPASAAVDAANPIPTGYPAALTPLSQYRHPADSVVRDQTGAQRDVGAFEWPDSTPAATNH